MSINSYPFEILSLPIGSLNIRHAQIENPELLFDELLKKNADDVDLEDERIPYWGDLWPSAIALSEFLSEHSAYVKDKNVIEIGCGMSLPGIVAAKLGGKVVLTDYIPAALEFASYNWKLNFDSEPEVRLLDWRNPGNISPVDVLLASDVAYESRAFKPLISTLKKLVKKEGIILISEPNRKYAKEFFDALSKEGFKITIETRNVVKDSLHYKVSVYLLKQDYLPQRH